MKAILNIFFIIIILVGCKTSSERLNPLTIESMALDSLWSIPNGYSIMPELHSENILVSWMFREQGDIYRSLNKVTGKINWEWYDYFKPGNANHHIIKNNILVIADGPRNYGVDLSSGHTIWRNQMPDHSAIAQIYFDGETYTYQTYIDDYDVSKIFRTNIINGNRDLVLAISDTFESYSKTIISPLTITKNSKGENILIMSLYLRPKGGDQSAKNVVLCYSLDHNRYKWSKDYTNQYREFSFNGFKAIGGNTFIFADFMQKDYLLCLNNDDGSITWSNEIPNQGVSMHLVNGNIIALCNGRTAVNCFNQKTGKLVWTQTFSNMNMPDHNFTFEDGTIFKNYLFSAQCDHLLVLDINNGLVKYYKNIALPNGCLQYGVAIDEAKRVFYVQDRYRIICYKLPKEIVY
jgi:outer membrane protein assembly factor BamB